MRIFSIAVAKNEADVIAHNLAEALKWSDKIFVMDNGSTDATWEIVQKMAERDERVVAWKSWDTPFLEGLRAVVFQQFRHVAKKGDWWCFRLDSDEFYLDDPKEFLSKVPSSYHVVCKESIEYKLTVEDIEEYTFEGSFPEDMPKIKYYSPKAWAEMRFFRHRDGLVWDPSHPFPEHIGLIWPGLIKVRHYQYRSPQQIQRRLDTRREAVELAARTYGEGHPGFTPWRHAVQANFAEKLAKRSDLLLDDGSIPRPLRIANAPSRSPMKFVIKRLLHGTGIWP